MTLSSPYPEKTTSRSAFGHGGSPYGQRQSGGKSGMRGRPTLFGDRMVTVSFRIPASYTSRIEEHSKKANESKSDFFRRAIDLALRYEVPEGEQRTNENVQ